MFRRINETYTMFLNEDRLKQGMLQNFLRHLVLLAD